jgi:hypothetical protein
MLIGDVCCLKDGETSVLIGGEHPYADRLITLTGYV